MDFSFLMVVCCINSGITATKLLSVFSISCVINVFNFLIFCSSISSSLCFDVYSEMYVA